MRDDGATRRASYHRGASTSTRFVAMTSTPTRARRPRGSLDPRTTAALYARVDEGTKAVFDQMADAAGESLGVVLERVARHIELDDSGLPAWWPEQPSQQEELPLKTA
ncbi:hypothetical protein CCE02nite_33340 [Cellulosimicrobium cellulans]|uniref:Uncharacterized protein n=2 Tax=Cellulosimicrobium cellulans TaxID=1710 RepID=A0A4Y4E5W8_CELCE|nr:hypothetical protein CCE02nite_33340 [Cellulosimicrobium cellulans]